MRRQKAIIGARLREAREYAGISRDEAAEAGGVQLAAITAWERGSSMPNLLQVRELLTCYGASSFRLLFGSCPLELTQEEAKELAAVKLSPRLRMKMDVVLAVARRTDPSRQRAAVEATRT